MMLSLFFATIVSVTLMLSRATKPHQSRMTLSADGTVHPYPTFDMLIASDVGHLYGMTDWP
jgi:hypothetical protein